jgi:hypothetical protein
MGLTLEETLDMVIRKADDMREKGILEFDGAGIRLRLAPKDQPEVSTSVTDEDNAAPVDPLDDPDTFGGEMPRRRGAPMKESDDE